MLTWEYETFTPAMISKYINHSWKSTARVSIWPHDCICQNCCGVAVLLANVNDVVSDKENIWSKMIKPHCANILAPRSKIIWLKTAQTNGTETSNVCWSACHIVMSWVVQWAWNAVDPFLQSVGAKCAVILWTVMQTSTRWMTLFVMEVTSHPPSIRLFRNCDLFVYSFLIEEWTN